MEQKFIKRHILSELKAHLQQKEITLIVGARQVGKTTLMKILQDELNKQGKNTIFLSLDFENDKKYFISQNSLIEKLRLEFGVNRGYVFLDEIQRKENAGLFLKGIYDLDLPYKFIVSGSGSMELKEKIHESLAGRKMIFEVNPVNFMEFVDFMTDYKYEKRLNSYFKVEKDKTFNFLNQYLNFGGYPRVILEKSFKQKQSLINEIYQSYLEKDIAYWLQVERLDAFSSLLKVLAGQAGQLVNYSEISNTLGISLPTVKNYLYFLEKTFIISKLAPFFRNVRKEISKAQIVYFCDLGLRNHALGILSQANQSDDLGFLFQNFIYNLLADKFKSSAGKINFWRTKEKAEVDFIINFNLQLIPVEVKYKNFKQPAIERSLKSFIDKYQPARALVVTKDFHGKKKFGQTEVRFLPFWELISFKF